MIGIQTSLKGQHDKLECTQQWDHYTCPECGRQGRFFCDPGQRMLCDGIKFIKDVRAVRPPIRLPKFLGESTPVKRVAPAERKIPVHPLALEDACDATVSELLDALLIDDKLKGSKRLDITGHLVRVHLRPFFGAMSGSVGSDDVRRYIAMCQQPASRKLENGKTRNYPGGSNATISGELTILRRAFNIAKKANPLRKPPVAATNHQAYDHKFR